MNSTKKINKRKSRIMSMIAKRDYLLLKDIYPHFDESRQTISNDLDDLVQAGCLKTIPVDEKMKEENKLSDGAGPFYTVNEEKIEECRYISDDQAQIIREEENLIREHMLENGLIENPSTEKIKDFLEEFLPNGKFEDRDEIQITRNEMNSEGLSLRESEEFSSLWHKVMASDPDWSIEMEMSIYPDNSDDETPDVKLLEKVQDFKDYLKEH